MSQIETQYSNIRPVDLTPLVCYQLYRSIKLHFTQDKFDYFKYGLCESKFTQESLDKDNSAIYYYKLSDKFLYKDRIIPLFVSNIYENPRIYIIEILDKDCISLAYKYRKYVGDFQNSFVSDIQKVILKYNISYKSIFDLNSNYNFLNLLIKKEISPITACVISKCSYNKYEDNAIMKFVHEDRIKRLDNLFDFVSKQCYNFNYDVDNIIELLKNKTYN